MNNKQSAVARNIYAIRNHFGYNQTDFAQKVGVSQVTVSKWETSGHSVSEKNIQSIMDAFSLSHDDVTSEESGFARKVNKPSGGWVSVPLFGRIAAGKPLEMDDCDGYGEVPEEVRDRHPGCFLLTVTGESMNRILPNGCHALVEPCADVERDGKPYAVCINGYDATVKRVRRLETGFELLPDSTDPTFKPRVYDRENPSDETVSIIGRVVYYVLPFDWEF